MNLFFIFFDVEWVKIFLLIGGTLVLTVVCVGIGGYFFLKIFASMLNSRQSSWESSAEKLGLSVDRSVGWIYKPLSGERDGRRLTVSPYSVQRTEHSADDYAAAEVTLKHSFPFSFEIEKSEMFYQKIAEAFDFGDPETGHRIFDETYNTSSSDMGSLNEILNVEMLDGQSPTLLTDLLLAARRFHRVKATNGSVTVGVKAEYSRADLIEPAIERALYLAERVETACRKSQQAIP